MKDDEARMITRDRSKYECTPRNSIFSLLCTNGLQMIENFIVYEKNTNLN